MANVDSESVDSKRYVAVIQDAVKKAGKRSDRKALEAKINALNRGGKRIPLQVRSEGSPREGIRVTCPSPTIVTANVPAAMSAEWVEFYLTRPRSDSASETRLLGTAKYPDSDGRWNIEFTSRRFARGPDDALVLHVEVFGRDGRLIAGHAVPIAD